MAFNSADIGAFKNVWVFCEQRQGVMLKGTDKEMVDDLTARLKAKHLI